MIEDDLLKQMRVTIDRQMELLKTQTDAVDNCIKIIEERDKQIDELEYRLSCVLDEAIGGCVSKPYTDIDVISKAIHNRNMKFWDEAIADYKEEH